MFDWDDLRGFLAVARGGSLAAAARTLGVNHSTVFRRLNGLEARLGVRLFERLPAGYVLTAAGEEMLATATRIEEEITALDRRLSGRDVRLGGTLRVTTTDTLALGLLPPHLARFRAAYPGIELELITSNAFFSLTKREADVALRPSRDADETMIGRRLSGIAAAVYGARAYLARHGGGYRPEDPADPAGHAWIAGDASLAHLGAARWLQARVPESAVALRCNSLMSQLAAVRAGIGVAALPCFLADPDPELVRVLPPDEAMASELWLLTHPDLRRTARIRAFVDLMAESLRGERARLEGEAVA